MKKVSMSELKADGLRFSGLKSMFSEKFGCEPKRYFSAPGRTEICGNHTDHNCGKVVAAAVDLDIIAAVVPTLDGVVTVKSEGYPEDIIDTADLEVKECEKNSSAALIRGVLAGMKNRGYKIGGFMAYTRSNVLKGSGLSSSAAFEVLIGTIISGLYNGGAVSEVEIAQIAQYAENEYFGKPSGLMDQMASSIGGFIKIDFKDPEKPIIFPMQFDPADFGYSLCIIDSKSDHADLTNDYAGIPSEMKKVAEMLGHSCLREVTKNDIISRIDDIRKACGDRALLRAFHFLNENVRVDLLESAISARNIVNFLSTINSSGDSSYKLLQNIYPCTVPEKQGVNQGVAVAICIASDILDGRGAVRVHGGGFAGTVQAFVPTDMLEKFKSEIEAVFGAGSCYVLNIRPFGGIEVAQ